MINKLRLLILILLMIPIITTADTWEDPEWKVMIDSSDCIALVKYTSDGMFKARAQILKIYKGQFSGTEIWIAGFSSQYGPRDVMKVGDKYIVFLNKTVYREKDSSYWNESVKEEPDLKQYFLSVKQGLAYRVWTPTSGDLRVKKKKVQYDLIQTSFYSKQKFNSLTEFELFLNCAINKSAPTEFYKNLVNNISVDIDKENCYKHILMLYLTNYKEYETIYEKLINSKYPATRFALVKLLGASKTDQSRNLLVKLMNDSSGVIQGEVVRQLSKESPEFLGPILLEKLKGSSEQGSYPSNIMNPIQNVLESGKIEIIKTLGQIKYKPAIDILAPLLNTEDEYQFNTIIYALLQLDSKAYIPYLQQHLRNKTDKLIYSITKLITRNELTECIPDLMYYIANHDKSKHPSKEYYLISTHSGLAHFKTDTVNKFLVSDFMNVLKMKSGGSIDCRKEWVEEYIELFIELKNDSLKKYIYNSLYDYFGFNYDFYTDNALFKVKRLAEDSLSQIIRDMTHSDSIKKIETIVFLDKNRDISDYVTKFTTKIKADFRDDKNLVAIVDKLVSFGINKDHLIVTSGSYSRVYSTKSFYDFDDQLMVKFLDYISMFSDKKDIIFMESLIKYGYFDKGNKLINKALITANENEKR